MSVLKINKVLISQPAPTNGSPYAEIISKHKTVFEFIPFFRVEPVSVRDFRAQHLNILDYSAIVFTSRTAIDSFFKLCEELRINIPETMKYFCQSEAIAVYLQKYIVYRKRKIFFGNGNPASMIDCIGTKHKGDNFLITCTDCQNPEINRMFVKAKLKHESAILVHIVNSDIKGLDLSRYGMIVFYSPSDVKSLFENFPDFKQGDLKFATFGISTAKAMKEAKLIAEVTAPTPEAPSIAKALSLYFDKK